MNLMNEFRIASSRAGDRYHTTIIDETRGWRGCPPPKWFAVRPDRPGRWRKPQTAGWPGATALDPARCGSTGHWQSAAAPCAARHSPGSPPRRQRRTDSAWRQPSRLRYDTAPRHCNRKIERVCDARPHTRIALEESIHAIPVTSEDNHEIVARVLHNLEQ